MAGPSVKVYYAKPVLPDVSRVLACLYEKDINFRLIDIYEGQHSAPPDFLKLQSKASTRVNVPAFDDGETKLFESRAICRYLAEKYAGSGNKMLLGRDSLERASIEQWLKTEEHSFDPPSWTLVFYLAFAPAMALQPDPIEMEKSERKLSEVLDVYEQRLAESSFLAGNEFTLADLSHLPNSHYLATNDLFTSRKNVSRWLTDISKRDSWRKVLEILKVPRERVPLLTGTIESGDTDRPSPPPQPQLPHAPHPPGQPASPAQPVQPPKEALKSAPLSVPTQPEHQPTTVEVPSQKTEIPASPAQPVQPPKEALKSAPLSVPTQPEHQPTTVEVPSQKTEIPASLAQPVQPPKEALKSAPVSVPTQPEHQPTTVKVPTQKTEMPASPAQPVQPPKEALKSAPVSVPTQPEHQPTTVEVPSRKTEITPSPAQPVQLPKEALKSAPVSVPTQPEHQPTTVKVPTQKTEMPAPLRSSPQQDDNSISQTVHSQPNNTIKSAVSPASSSASSPKQGTNGEKSGPQSSKDTSQTTTKAVDSESTPSRTSDTPVMPGSSEQLAGQFTMGTDHIGFTKTGSTQQVPSQPTPGKGAPAAEQGSNGEKTGPQSTKDTFQKAANTVEHESTQTGSNATPARQGRSELIASTKAMSTDRPISTEMGSTQQTTSQQTSGKVAASPEHGTSDEIYVPQPTKDTSQKGTKTEENDSTKSTSNSTPAMQGGSEEIAHQQAMGKDYAGSTDIGTIQQTSQPITEKDVLSPKQGTNGGKADPRSIKDTSLKAMKTTESESTKSESNTKPPEQDNSEQIAHQQAMGANHAGSNEISFTRQVTSQQTPGKDVSSPEQDISAEKSGPQATKDTPKKGTQMMENESTKSRSNDSPAMQGSLKETDRQQAMGKDYAGSTKTGSTQQMTSESTPEKDVPSLEQSASGGKLDPQSTKNTSPKATTPTEHESTQFGSNEKPPKQDNAEQIDHQPITGTNHVGSTENTQQATSQPTPGKDGKSGHQSTEDTSQMGTKTMETEPTKSRSLATPAMQGSSEETGHQQAMSKDHVASTEIESTQQMASPPTPRKDVSSPERRTNGENFGSQATED